MYVVFSVLGMECGQPREVLLRHGDPRQEPQNHGEGALRGARPCRPNQN